MKRMFGCLVIMVVLPLMTSPTHHGSGAANPVAYAGHTAAEGLSECVFTPGLDGNCICPCCLAEGPSCKDGSQTRHASHSMNHGAASASTPSSLSLATCTLFLVIALLAWSAA